MAISWQKTMLPVLYLRLNYIELDNAFVGKLVSDNAPDIWEPISVLQRSKRVYVVKDGNHRVMAAKGSHVNNMTNNVVTWSMPWTDSGQSRSGYFSESPKRLGLKKVLCELLGIQE